MTRLKINSSICQRPLDILNSSKVSDTTMMLVSVRAIPVYEEGVRTDKTEGYFYDCVDLFSFDRIAIKVENTKPLIDPDELLERREAGEKVFVKIIGGTITAYYSERSNSIEDSFKARSIELATEPDL